jgi:hypothetical protein
MKAKERQTKTYEATFRGRKTRVTIPEREDPAEPAKELRDLLQDCMSPQAVAVLANAATIQFHRGIKDRSVAIEVKWFAELLTKMVGGGHECYRLCTEAGL